MRPKLVHAVEVNKTILIAFHGSDLNDDSVRSRTQLKEESKKRQVIIIVYLAFHAHSMPQDGLQCKKSYNTTSKKELS